MESIFNNSKYTKWYNIIINKSTNRVLTGYLETHHVIPKSLGGSNEQKNLVKLTAKEHFVCHWLLTKMTNGQNQIKMAFAFNAFCRSSKGQERILSGLEYDIIRKKVSIGRSEFLKGNTYNLGKKRQPLSEEVKRKISEANKGRILTPEQRLKISEFQKGRPTSEETKAKMRKPKPEGFGEKIREANKGKKLSEETKRKISESKKSK